jgi:hypothetical protein
MPILSQISVSVILMPKPFEADIVALAAGQKLDRGDAEILQDLRTEADFQPFAFTVLRFGMFFAALARALRPLS